MPAEISLASVLDSCSDMIRAGAALHWLKPRKKSPIVEGWPSEPIHTLASFEAAHRPNQNVGVRLGEPSRTAAGYLHLIDLDIRSESERDAALSTLRKLWPEFEQAPMVASGSGGSSRHVYFLSATPMHSRKLAKSTGFRMVFDKAKDRDVKKHDWEIDLLGTGKQAVLPPSIHPDTGLPYRWLRPFDWATLGLMGDDPIVSTEVIESWGVREAEVLDDEEAEFLAATRSAPLTDLTDDDVRRILTDLPPEYVEDRHLWAETVGMALHHQYEGSNKGFEIWCEWSKQSSKFDARNSAAVWRSIRGSSNPATMRSLIAASAQHKALDGLDWMEEVSEPQLPAVVPVDDFSDLMGGPAPATASPGAPDPDWKRQLAVSEEGGIKSTATNVTLIVANDPRLYGRIGFNALLQTTVLISEPAQFRRKVKGNQKPILQLQGAIWQIDNRRGERRSGKRWIDPHTGALRIVFEGTKSQGGYEIKISDRDLNTAIEKVARDHTFHPVRDYLRDGVGAWDGKPRIDTMFVDHLGAADTPYHRQAARLLILGAIARAFEPGCKFDFVPILEGPQGIRKSTWIATLGKHWTTELSCDFDHNERVVESIQGTWISEIPELQGFSKAETTTLKAVVSRQVDRARLAYDRRPQDFPRQCIFIGSTNDKDYLRDTTGGRRFWPVECAVDEIDTARFAREVDQIWAEGVAIYDAMRKAQPFGELPLYLTDPEAVAEVKVLQDSRRAESPEDVLAAEIAGALAEPISADLDGNTEPREFTCILELWVDLLKRDRRDLGSQVTTRLIGKALRMAGWAPTGNRRFPRYGVQKSYRKS